ncbi:MAG: hypothetical protein ABSC00_06160 [Acidimicrobiales bacterium]|jgi:cation:H+ antiporter
MGVDLAELVLGAIVSLSASFLLISRLERLGERFGLSEALLGVVAALAADAPEISSAVTALVHRQRAVGAGVVLGSNVFNLAALLGLGAVVAGWVVLHRRVVVLAGSVAMFIAVLTLATITGAVSGVLGLVIVAVVLVPYIVLLGTQGRLPRWPGLPRRWSLWARAAVVEEEQELYPAIHPRRGQPRDAAFAVGALCLVVGASVVMERAGSAVGRHYLVPDIVVGGILLAVVTSLPNAVAAVYLASRGRGAAALSTALNSNTFNVVAGLLVPAVTLGLGRPQAQGTLVAAWYVGLTACTLALAYAGRGLSRVSGSIVIAGYLAFVVVLLAT